VTSQKEKRMEWNNVVVNEFIMAAQEPKDPDGIPLASQIT